LQSGSYPGLLQRQIAYSYDGLSRLLRAQYTDNGAASFNYQYTYDLNSNRLTTLGQNLLNPTHSTFDATTYTYNDANQVQTAVDQNGKTAFIYYPDGMLGFQSYQPVNNVNSASTIGYTYDAADRLSKVVNALTNQTTNYTYDGLSHRVAMYASVNAQSVFTTYLVDPTGSLPQALAEYPNAAGTSPTYYIPAGTLIGQDQGGTTGLSYFATDGLGSVRATFNNGGSQTGLTSYEPYGKPLPDPIEPGIASHLGYSGALTDANGLIYLNARYYNPGDGQFLSSDPLAGKPADPSSFNLYGYVYGNPITGTDPSGKMTIDNEGEPSGEDGGPPDYNGAFGGGGGETTPITHTYTSTFDAESGMSTSTEVFTGAPGYTKIEITTTSEDGSYTVRTSTTTPDGTTTTTDTYGGDSDPTTHEHTSSGTDNADPKLNRLEQQQNAKDNTVPNIPSDPKTSPGPDWVWRGPDAPGGERGAWYNPKTGASLHPDLNHPAPYDAHWDYVAPNGDQYRVYPDGRVEPK